MAGASMNDIKARMKSVQNTMQITKAMELVATSKLRHAKEQAENSRAFHTALGEAIRVIRSAEPVRESAWARTAADPVTLYVVIAGDRGLAGGYNANIFRLAQSLAQSGRALYLPIGKKALDGFRHKGEEIFSEDFPFVAGTSVGECFEAGRLIAEGFLAGRFDRVELVYTSFRSMMTQTPVHETLLPFGAPEETDERSAPAIEEDAEEMLAKIVPTYLGGAIHAAISEALASESAARRTAMNAANKNAGEMIDDLTLRFNRARQAVITQEITEIVSGAEAL